MTSRAYWSFLLALSVVAGLAELAFIIVNVSAMSVYLTEGLRLPALAGIALGAFYLAEAAGNPIMGALGDRLGRRRLMTLGGLLSTLTCLLTAGIAFLPLPRTPLVLAAVVGAILLFRLLDGLGAAMLWPAVFASIGDRIEEKKQGQAMTFLNVTYLVGIAIGPFIGGLVNDTVGGTLAKSDPRRYAPSFFIGAACFLLTALLAYYFAPRRKEQAPLADHQQHIEEAHEPVVGEIAQAAHPPVGLSSLKYALKTVPSLLVLGFLIFFGVGLIAPYVKPFLMARYDLSEQKFGTLLLGPALLIGIVSVPLGHLTDRWGKPRSIHVGMGICALSLWCILFLKSEHAVLVLGSLLGIGFVLSFPAYMAYLSEIAGPNDRGGTIGAVRMAQGVGALLGSVLASPLYPMDGEHLTLFVTAGSVLTLGFVLSLFFVRSRPQPVESAPTA